MNPHSSAGAVDESEDEARVRFAERLWPDLSPERIVYEDDDLIVIDKPAGVPCQAPDPSQAVDLPARLRRFLSQRRGVPLEQVYIGTHQRLDQATSGLLLYSLHPRANKALASQFEGRRVDKQYLAAVQGRLPRRGERLLHWLVPDGAGRMRTVGAGARSPGHPHAKQASSEIVSTRERGGRALLGVRIETGRTHQVRVQLAAIGAPVAGDPLYGGAPAFRMLLHSQRLAFDHPRDGRRIALETAAPLEFDDWLAHGPRPAYRDPALLARALEHACERRFELGRALAAGTTSAFRLLHEDADGVPSFGVDVYGSRLVLRVRDEVAPADESALLAGLARLGARATYIKRHPKQANELANEAVERIAPSRPVLGDAAPDALIVHEDGVPFEVRLHDGLRTGLFLDQRDNRKRVAELASGQRVLNLFAYTGSFSVSALAGGARSVTTVDVSRAALAWAERNVARVGATSRHRVLAEDAFVALSQLAARGERFDLVIVDPPSYSTSKRGRFRVTKDYVTLCRAALRVLDAGGVLLACVNHHGLSQLALRRFVREAASAERVQLESLRDAPVPADFPAGGRSESPTKSVFARVTAPAAGGRAPDVHGR